MSRKTTAESVTPLLRRILCKPLLATPAPLIIPLEGVDTEERTVSEVISLMSSLLVNADPSPAMIHLLLSPIIVPLYSLMSFLEDRRGAILNEPTLRELSRGLVLTWGRVAGSQDVTKGWWNIIQGTGGWGIDEGDDDSPNANAPKEWAIRGGEPIITNR